MNETVMVKPSEWTDAGDKVLILRACDKLRQGHDGFQWPESGPVEAPDWCPVKSCIGGLHGWPWGMGIGEEREYDLINDVWIVFSADPIDVVGNWTAELNARPSVERLFTPEILRMPGSGSTREEID